MSTPSQPAQAVASTEKKPCPLATFVKPFLTPYYLAIAGLLGAATAGFVVLIAVLIIIATNFNVVGWME